MSEPRLAAGIWVSAYLARLGQANIPAYVVARGDETAGAVLIKCATFDRRAALWRREWDFETDTRPWVMFSQGMECDMDAAIARERMSDPDLWVIEIESPRGETLLDQM